MADGLAIAEGDLFQPLDYIPKLSGYLSREGYDEDSRFMTSRRVFQDTQGPWLTQHASRMQECTRQILRSHPSKLSIQRWSPTSELPTSYSHAH